MAKFNITERNANESFELAMYDSNIEITNDVIGNLASEYGEIAYRLDADAAYECGYDYRINGIGFEWLIEKFHELADENKHWECFEDYKPR